MSVVNRAQECIDQHPAAGRLASLEARDYLRLSSAEKGEVKKWLRGLGYGPEHVTRYQAEPDPAREISVTEDFLDAGREVKWWADTWTVTLTVNRHGVGYSVPPDNWYRHIFDGDSHREPGGRDALHQHVVEAPDQSGNAVKNWLELGDYQVNGDCRFCDAGLPLKLRAGITAKVVLKGVTTPPPLRSEA